MAVLVIVEHDGKRLKPGVTNTVTAAGKLGDVTALVAGKEGAEAAQAAAKVAGDAHPEPAGMTEPFPTPGHDVAPSDDARPGGGHVLNHPVLPCVLDERARLFPGRRFHNRQEPAFAADLCKAFIEAFEIVRRAAADVNGGDFTCGHALEDAWWSTASSSAMATSVDRPRVRPSARWPYLPQTATG